MQYNYTNLNRLVDALIIFYGIYMFCMGFYLGERSQRKARKNDRKRNY